MSDWMDRITNRKTKSAKNAKDRLKLVLIHDRTDLSPQTLSELKNDLLLSISKYIEIDPSTVTIRMSQEGREQRLVADIPIKASYRKRIN